MEYLNIIKEILLPLYPPGPFQIYTPSASSFLLVSSVSSHPLALPPPSLSSPCPLLLLFCLSSPLGVSYPPSLLLTSALHFLFLLPFPCLLFFFFFPSWCLFYPSSPLPCSLQILPPLTVDFFTLALSSFFSCCFSPLPPSAAFLPHHLNNAMTKIQKCIYNKQSISCLPSLGFSFMVFPFPPPFLGHLSYSIRPYLLIIPLPSFSSLFIPSYAPTFPDLTRPFPLFLHLFLSLFHFQLPFAFPFK